MNNKVIGAIGFVAGAAIGSLVTWKIVETKYKRIAEEEIASVNALYSGKKKVEDEEYEPLKDEDYFVREEDLTEEERAKHTHFSEKPDLMKMASLIKEKGYNTDYSKMSESDERPELPDEEEEVIARDDDVDEPYVIDPLEFGENPEYDQITLIYFAGDDTLATDDYNTFEDIDEVGDDFAEHIGEYENGAVHIRNDKSMTDYEIIEDPRTFLSIIAPKGI